MPASSADRPDLASASTSARAVVRLPMAESVPSTAMRTESTSAIFPVKKCSCERGGGLRMSRSVTPLAAARAASSGSSERKSCRPQSTFNPASMARATSARADAGSRPPSGASPITRCVAARPSARERAIAASNPATTGMPQGFPSSTSPASRPAKRESTTPVTT